MALSPIEKRLAMMLTTYWQEHRCASDTPEGMQRWWFPEGDSGTPEQLQGALAWLLACKLVRSVRARDGRIRYRLHDGLSDDSFAKVAQRLSGKVD